MWRLLRIPLLILCSILFALLLVEAALRLVDYRLPPKSGFHTQGWAERNELLGWCYRPGTWRVDYEQRPMTILDDRSRKVTGGKPNQNGPTILLVGCSYAAGYGVTDDESMASRIQTYYSGVRVINLATPGYGTYQSYLILKKYLDEHANTPPNVVVYGYAEHQPIRNVADWRWISSLKSYSGSQIVQPHLEKQQNNTWKEVPTIEHNLLSMSGVSSLVFMIQSVMLERRYGTKSDNLHLEATNYSMLLMDRLCSNRDISFVTINIFNNQSAEQTGITNFCKNNSILFIQPKLDVRWCAPDWFLSDGVQFGHPNEHWHDEMGKEISMILKEHWDKRPIQTVSRNVAQ